MTTITIILKYLITIITTLVITAIGISLLPREPNIEILSIQSGSMEPTIKVGSVAISIPMKKYKVGDVIAFRPSGETIVTHRITDINEKTGQITTKGDANEETDQNRITKRNINGKVIFWIPFIGYLTNFTQTFTGLTIAIIVPSILIIGSELSSIVNEIFNLAEKRKNINNIHKP